MDLEKSIRSLKDYPKKGIIFRDINPLLANKESFQEAIDLMVKGVKDHDFDLIAGVEARGFIVGAAMAAKIGCGFVPIRKTGKLVGDVVKKSYSLEYGEDALEIQRDIFPKGSKILVVDDLLATGGTSTATKALVEEIGGEVVAFSYLIELMDLEGRKLLEPTPVYSVIQYK